MHPEDPPPSRGEIAEALRKVLGSRAFTRSPRSRTFLSFVVSESLAGRGDELSERIVGRRALGRDSAFLGASDSSVRVTATRVRQTLERYYAIEGVGDTVRIVLPPGGYVPAFHVTSGQEPVMSLVPGLLVITPTPEGGADARILADSIADALVAHLSHYGGLRVVGPTNPADDLPRQGRQLGVTHVLDGRVVVRGRKTRVSSRLLSAQDGAVAWSHMRDDLTDATDTFDVEDAWARDVATVIADVGGALVHDVLHRPPVELASGAVVGAQLAYYSYIDTTTRQSIEAAAGALDEALERGYRTAPLLAMRGAVANAAVLQESGDPERDTGLAESLGREALGIDPGSAHAYLVLGGAARARRRWPQCRQFAEAAAQLAPWQPTNVFTAGLLHAASGDWGVGVSYMERALDLNPRLPVHVHLWLALGYTLLGRYDRALGEATLINVDGEIFGPLYRALALSGLGDTEGARSELVRLNSIDPTFLDDVDGQFTSSLNLTSGQVDRMVALLDQARPN